MSQENVEILRSIYAAWDRGDFSSTEWAHPEIELVNDDGPALGTYKGVAAMVEGWRDFLGAWEDYRVEVEEYRELDGDRVLVLMLHCGRGKASGMAIGHMGTRRAGANVVHVRDGRVTKIILYWDRENAFADLDLLGVGDVAGEHRDRASRSCFVERGRPRCPS